MLLEVFIYTTSLVTCIALGSYYKSIEETELRKNYGAGLGMLIVCLVCRRNFIHSFIMVIGNIMIIKCCDKRYLHQLSLGFTWLYLLYINWNLNVSIPVMWIYQILALRLVGLAFEMHLMDKGKLTETPRRSTLTNTKSGVKLPTTSTSGVKSSTAITTECNLDSGPTGMEILSYAYFFVGIHKGPYYKLKVFNDYFDLPYPTAGDCRSITLDKLKNLAVCFAAYTLLSMKFPTDAYVVDEFYQRYGSEYRFLYNIPQLAIYYLYHQIIMTLCTCVFTETGFGVYPTKWNALPGLGPMRASSIKFSDDTNRSSEIKLTYEQEYNFSMIKCFDNEKLLMGPMMRDSMRAWDMPTQYWFWAYINKSLLKSNKEVRSACSFLIWTMWFGPTLAQLLFSITIWIYVHLENEYDVLFNNSDSMKIAWDIGYSIMRMLCLVYITPCLVLNDFPAVVRYYTSIYWSFHMLLVVLTVAAVAAYRNRERY